jgi:hypothetical protein
MRQLKPEVNQKTASVVVILMNAKQKPWRALYYGCVKGNCIFWVNPRAVMGAEPYIYVSILSHYFNPKKT